MSVRVKKMSIFIILNALLLSCGGGSPATSEAAVSQEWDTWEDCLNGLAVASLDGKWGVVSCDGKIVVPLEFDDAYMLTDDLIAALKGEECDIFSKEGDRLAEFPDAAGLAPSELLSRYDALSSRQAEAWEKVVSDYERLCFMASRGASIGDIRALADSIKLKVNSIDGGSLSKADLSKIENAYKEVAR